jgi:hypothetical protein
MAGWGTGNFHNDDALEWVVDLESDGDIDMLEEAFEAILFQRESAEAPDCCVALAAAEVVAAMLDSPPDVMPKEVHNWLAGNNSPPRALISQAQRAVSAILRDSALKDEWFESGGDYKEWLEVVTDLQERLA